MNIGNMMYGVNVVNNVGSSHIISKLTTGQEMFENIQVHALHKCKLYTPTKVTQTEMILAWLDIILSKDVVILKTIGLFLGVNRILVMYVQKEIAIIH